MFVGPHVNSSVTRSGLKEFTQFASIRFDVFAIMPRVGLPPRRLDRKAGRYELIPSGQKWQTADAIQQPAGVDNVGGIALSLLTGRCYARQQRMEMRCVLSPSPRPCAKADFAPRMSPKLTCLRSRWSEKGQIELSFRRRG